MGYGYSVDFRNKVVQAIIKLGLTHKATAEIFDIGEATITRWLRRYKERGNLNPEPHAGGRELGIGNGEHLNRLERIVHNKPDATTKELTHLYNKRAKVKVSRSAIVRGLKRLKFTRKKKTYKSQEASTPAAKKLQKKFKMKCAATAPSKFVFIDESGAKADINRTHARSQSGKRVHDIRIGQPGKNITMIAGLTKEGMIAPQSMLGPMNGRKFIKWLRNNLLPRLSPRTVIVMDNLRIHHMKAVKKELDVHKCSALYLPPYRPDLNPIEMAWSKIKSYLRRVRPKSVKSLQTLFHQSINTISTTDAKGYMGACGVSV